MAQSSDFDQRFQILGAAMSLRDLEAQANTIRERHPEADALAKLLAESNGHGPAVLLSDAVRNFLDGTTTLPKASRKHRATGGSSKQALRERYDAIKRPAERDASFPRMRGPLTLKNLEGFEERVAAYWAER
jgi:hypothetical protein